MSIIFSVVRSSYHVGGAKTGEAHSLPGTSLLVGDCCTSDKETLATPSEFVDMATNPTTDGVRAMPPFHLLAIEDTSSSPLSDILVTTSSSHRFTYSVGGTKTGEAHSLPGTSLLVGDCCTSDKHPGSVLIRRFTVIELIMSRL